jgi:hypothetical protein
MSRQTVARQPARLVAWIAAAAVATAWLMAASVPGSADLPLLDIVPKSVRQGDCAFVIVRPGAVPPAAGECRWLGKTYTLFAAGDGYRAILPVSPDAPTGLRSVVVVLQDGAGESRETSLPVTIIKRAFGVQKLRMSKETSRLYTDPSVEQEGKTIHAALAQVSDEQLWQGPFAWPVSGKVTTGFGLARTINGAIQYRHRGLDISGAAGSPVFAPAAGIVRLVRQDFKLHGKTIVLDHGQGVGSIYLHLSEILVKEGQRVARGELIGRVGATGAATGPHLHWGTYVAGESVDPRFWINLPAAGR